MSQIALFIFIQIALCGAALGGEAADIEVCLLPKETGLGRAAFKKFYFDNNERSCKQFIYGGSGGNGNRFDTKQECENVCKK
uniref:BPTI/Kunitz inhibitor domain-containing protein n=1 Tax=Globodera rostochiensis TaxID=31243 RepID=A0A914HZT4_GLORO